MSPSPGILYNDVDGLPALRGFKVPRNGCFGAATLQCLCRLGDFDHIDHDHLTDVVSTFIRLCRDINSDSIYDYPVSMKDIWDALRKSVRNNAQLRSMFDGQQMDAEEFLRHMMDLLESDERTSGLQLFESTTIHLKACVHRMCPRRAVRPYGPREEDASTILKLPIVHERVVEDRETLKTIGNMMEMEYGIELNDEFECELCIGQKADSGGMYTAREITAWPQVLVVQVVRNDTNDVRFDTAMKIEPTVRLDTAPGVYELVSYVDHIGGSSANSGHYVAHCKVGDTWVEFDDDKVNPQRELDETSTCNTLMFYQLLSSIRD
jgi:ubiquitin C-terminal hydrolase